MNKKILIGGSSIAVVILVLASFSPVVGYNSVESSVKDSPLFNIRLKNAIDSRQDTPESNYIGKGDIFPIPARNNKLELVEKTLDNIKMMDAESFDKFTDLIIKVLQTQDIVQDEEAEKVITILHQFRGDDTNIIKDFKKINDNVYFSGAGMTCEQTPIRCFLLELFLILAMILYFISYISVYGW